jgi:DNA-binding IclR family transcriptional regulator
MNAKLHAVKAKRQGEGDVAGEIRTRNRILHILQLYDRSAAWSVEEIAVEMDVSVSSAYRDVQELVRADFLTPVMGARYVLGPTFAHFDLLMRHGDPLLRVAEPLMRRLIEATTPSSASVLTRSYQDKVMCIHQEIGDPAARIGRYERGATMPMFRGATSKVILAHQSRRALERMYLAHEEEVRAISHWKSLKDLCLELDAIREAGVAVSDSEITPGTIGIAAPIFLEQRVVAGLSLIVRAEHCRLEPFRAAVIDAASQISSQLAEVEGAWVARA